MSCPDCHQKASDHCKNSACRWKWCIPCKVVFDPDGRRFDKP